MEFLKILTADFRKNKKSKGFAYPKF